MKVDIVTSDDIKIYYTRKLQDFTARYVINNSVSVVIVLAFPPGILGSNPARTLFFCHAFVRLCLC